MKKCFFFLLFVTTGSAQNFSNGFNFNLAWNDSTSQKFLPQFPIIPIPQNSFVTVDVDGNFNLSSKKIKFWGVNSVADGAFPDKNIAGAIAGRMRKVGINLVRFHHIDNGWGGYSLLKGVDTRSLYSANLDLLEYYISKLKENGIFINMNLNVSRRFTVFDGVIDADSIFNYGTEFAKGITLFDPYLIMLQKEYAQQLLTHVNPYTGKALVNDPVMAMVETNNENSLYRFWMSNQLKPITSGGKLIYRHVRMLDSLFNKFIADKYKTTANLQSAWNQGTVQAGKNDQIKNGGFEQVSSFNSDWELELHSPAAGTTSQDVSNPYAGNLSAKVSITNSTGTDWHIQFKQKTLTVYKDSAYTITFAARADAPKQISVSMMNDYSPWNWYGGIVINLTTSWKVFSFNIKALKTNIGHTRLTFNPGKYTGAFWFDNVSVTSAGVSGLNKDESIELQNIRRIDYTDCVSYSDQRVKDISEFYIKLQRDYFVDMINYLHNTLGVKVPIVGTNWTVGAADNASISGSDYIDNHAYWDHPQFPNNPWSQTDWLINNQPMVKDSYGGTMPDLFAGVPMVGKPYTISEYNHAFPNRYQSEALLFLTGYSSFHGADGIMMFDYSGDRKNWNSDWVNGYFDIHRNSIYMSLFPSCAFTFRNSLIDKSKNMIKINYTPEALYLFPKSVVNDWHAATGYDHHLALRNAVRTESYTSSNQTNFNSLPSIPTNPYKTDTDQITYNTSEGILTVASDKFNGAAGFLSSLKNTRVGDFVVIDFSTSDFGSMTWISLTNEKLSQSKKSLITLASKLQNSGMIWNSYNNSLNNNWGRNPTSIYPLNIKLDLNIYADSIKIYPLDSKGIENIIPAFIVKPSTKNHFMVELDQNNYKTLWFGVEKYGVGDPTSVENENGIPTEFKLEQNYPNPFNPGTVISYQLAASGHVSLKIYDILGREVATLVDEIKHPGVYHSTFSTLHSALTTGVYFYILKTNNYLSTKKMMILK
ncbi:MAG: carbohydrate binding domain-containing protein [Melioribacteraceae bacterium]